MKILLVEDEEIIAHVHRLFIEMGGHEVVAWTDNAEDAVRMAEELKPDVIVMDIRINSEKDGVDATKEIQEKHPTPVIYVSGNSDKWTLDRIATTNYLGFLVKPILANELNDAINLHKTA
jgi:DNA-binding NarL/FixJ family response regulator